MKWTYFFLLLSIYSSAQTSTSKPVQSYIPGYSIAKVDSSGVLFMESYGLSNLVSGRERKNSSRQNIASVSKLVLGLAIMIAVEKKYLSLDSEINSFLPFKIQNPNFPELPITLRMLANHTSSIRDHKVEFRSVFLDERDGEKNIEANRETRKYFTKWKNNNPLELSDFLRSALTENGTLYQKRRFSKKPPGNLHHYSNLGAALAALVLQEAVGISYDKFVEREVLIPLNLSDTRWDRYDTNSLVSYYFENNFPTPKYTSILYPAGGLNTSCEDLANLLSEIIRSYQGSGKLITKKSAKILLSGQLTDSQNTLINPKNYGIFSEINKTQVGHNGSNYGITVLMSINTQTGIGKIFMTNISSYQSSTLIQEMIKIYNAI